MQRSRTPIIHHSIFVKVVTLTLAISCPYKEQKGYHLLHLFSFLSVESLPGMWIICIEIELTHSWHRAGAMWCYRVQKAVFSPSVILILTRHNPANDGFVY